MKVLNPKTFIVLGLGCVVVDLSWVDENILIMIRRNKKWKMKGMCDSMEQQWYVVVRWFALAGYWLESYVLFIEQIIWIRRKWISRFLFLSLWLRENAFPWFSMCMRFIPSSYWTFLTFFGNYSIFYGLKREFLLVEILMRKFWEAGAVMCIKRMAEWGEPIVGDVCDLCKSF